MIKSIQLNNFRRHAEVDLRFDDDAQLILVAGSNGAGKSTILEGIVFALYGEGRHGRKHLDRLTKRGRELEGMSAEVVFTVGNDTYRVHRRRDGKSSTAVLYVNDIPLVEGPVQVTAEVTNVLGMDSAGFRLAVIAQQKDLDGLASLRPAERAQMVTRLLRLDALTAAKNEASLIFRKERDVASDLRLSAGVDLEADITAAREQLLGYQEELRRSEEALTLADAELAATQDVEALWSSSTQAVARAQGAIDQAQKQLADQEHELGTISIPVESAVQVDVVDLAERTSALERKIAQAEQQHQLHEQRQAIARDLEQVTLKLSAAQKVVDAGEPDVQAAQRALVGSEERYAQATEDASALRAEVAAAFARLQEAERRMKRAEELDAKCDACGQDVSQEHREAQKRSAAQDYEESAREHRQLSDRLAASAQTVDVARTELDKATQHLEEVKGAAARFGQASEAAADLSLRASVYQGQLERLPQDIEDLDGLYAEKGKLALLAAEARRAQEVEQQRRQAVARKESLLNAVQASRARLVQLESDLQAAQPGADLRARYQERQLRVESRRHEEELATHWRTQVAVGQERLDAAAKRKAEADAVWERQRAHQAAAVNAGAASRLLSDVADRLSTQIRPTLEGAVSALLATMSEGRFASVKITPEYDILVQDDDAYRPLSELSGGEVDLVALATRLALSQVVADRHGAGGAGFLILDECFGSQDPQRRASILDALRSLRGVYDQIFVISHVENIEDAADMVVQVSVSDDREETEVLTT